MPRNNRNNNNNRRRTRIVTDNPTIIDSDRIVTDRDDLLDTRPTLQKAVAPLLMMPLRLEYRVINSGVSLEYASPEMMSSPARSRVNGRHTIAAAKTSMKFESVKQGSKKILFRWFPDSPFRYAGIAQPAEEELQALESFNQAIPSSKHWTDIQDSSVADAWRNFAANVGVFRALHLKRNAGEVSDEEAERALKIFALPDSVSLFAVNGDKVTSLLTRSIETEITMAPADLAADGWMIDFQKAKSLGMGAELTKDSAVETALAADWIIAAGINSKDNQDDLAEFIRDKVAEGGIELMDQDVPTNNTSQAVVSLLSDKADILSVVEASTYAEQRERDSSSEQSKDISDAGFMAAALGVDTDTAYQMPGAANQTHQDAVDMATVLIPGLAAAQFGDIASEDPFSLDQMTRYMAHYVFARGPLPGLRLGGNPYGILPILHSHDVTFPTGEENEESVAELLAYMAENTMDYLKSSASSQPFITPGDADVAEKLEEILQQSAVSLRVDVNDIGEDEDQIRGLGCKYVTSSNYDPAEYLPDFASKVLSSMDKPTKTSTSMPLLYRLIYASRSEIDSLSSSLPVGGVVIGGSRLGARASSRTRRTHGVLGHRTLETTLGSIGLKAPLSGYPEFKNALSRLAKKDDAALEVLMTEVIDVLSHRADALWTGLAYYRLNHQRQSKASQLKLGYYGLIGKLRSESTQQSDGFIHAPSLQQATSAALLKSASTRHTDEGGYAIDLSSQRVRYATQLLDLINNGFSLSEALGYRAERWLHDQQQDALIYTLRTEFPLDAGEGNTSRPLIDGYAMQQEETLTISGLSTDEQAALTKLKTILDDYLDALSDLITAESVHAMANGDYGLANAWVQVLSGNPPPSSLAFSSTARNGAAETYRTALVCDAKTADSHASGSPRAVAEPLLASLAKDWLGDLKGVTFACRIASSLDESLFEAQSHTIDLGNDLGLEPIDLVIGRAGELKQRCAHYVYHQVNQHYPDIVQSIVEAAPNQSLGRTLTTLTTLTLETAGLLGTLINKAQLLRRLFAVMRPLEPTDIYADVEQVLTLSEEDLLGHYQTGAAHLKERANGLYSGLGSLVTSLENTLTELHTQAASQAISAATYDQLQSYLRKASRFALPQALTIWHTEQFITITDDGAAALSDAVYNAISGVITALSQKATGLQAALLTVSGASDAEGYKTAQDALVSALQTTLDGDALTIMPLFNQDVSLLPKTKLTDSSKAKLAEWTSVRPKIQRLNACIEGSYPHSLLTAPSHEKAGHHVTYVVPKGCQPFAEGTAYLAGGIIDEWSLFQPSDKQLTGLAVNYDAPQAEAPNCLLLGVAANEQLSSWDAETAAGVVKEMISQMQCRAVPARQATYTSAGLNFAPKVKRNDDDTQRIPESMFSMVEFYKDGLIGINRVNAISAASTTARNINERKRVGS